MRECIWIELGVLTLFVAIWRRFGYLPRGFLIQMATVEKAHLVEIVGIQLRAWELWDLVMSWDRVELWWVRILISNFSFHFLYSKKFIISKNNILWNLVETMIVFGNKRSFFTKKKKRSLHPPQKNPIQPHGPFWLVYFKKKLYQLIKQSLII